MSLRQIDLTTALRPSLSPDEVLLFVQDNVGLYEGKYKIPEHQNGQAYLTSHRICYVDNDDPRKHSVGVDLKDVDRVEYYAGFLKSSPKITLVPKLQKLSPFQARSAALGVPSRSANSSPATRAGSPSYPTADRKPASNVTWVCPICSLSNSVPTNFDPTTATIHTPLPPCLACGIKPPLALLLKAAISNVANRSTASPIPTCTAPESPLSEALLPGEGRLPQSTAIGQASFQCPRCTFLNHPSLVSCELCGASLVTRSANDRLNEPLRPESPAPVLQSFNALKVGTPENIKLSFRSGGSQIFHERLKSAMIQRKWLSYDAPPVPKPNTDGSSGTVAGPTERVKVAGIAGLEQQRKAMTKNNELAIGSAFEDLETLMASAKEIVALAEQFAAQTGGVSGSSEDSTLLANSAAALGLVTTKDMLGKSSGSQSLYLNELARNLAEFLTDDRTSILRKHGGIISLIDLWAIFNRARNGIELVSPTDFKQATELWEKLHLPVRLRKFRSGVLVVQGTDRTDEKTIKALLSWLASLHQPDEDDKEVEWDRGQWGVGVTPRDAALHFGWSIGVAAEELEMAEEHGALCREEGIGGLTFWENWFDTLDMESAAS